MIPSFITADSNLPPLNATVRSVPAGRQEVDVRGSALLSGEVGDKQSVWQRAGDFRRRGHPDGAPIIIRGDQEIDCVRTTTWISVIDDKSTLNSWKIRKVLEGLVTDLGHLGAIQSVLADTSLEPAQRNHRLADIAELAQGSAGAHEAREYGTAQHKLVEQTIQTGEVPDMPEIFRTDHEAIMNALAPFEIIGSEIPGVNADLGVAGTMDLLVKYNNRVYTADLKTGSFNAQSVAMQLAVYSSMSRYDVVTDEMLPLVEDGTSVNRQVGFCIHAPKGKGWAKIRPVNLIQGQQDVELARQVHAARKVRVADYTMDFGQWTSQGKILN